ncbi:MAG TPA: hypothetical protein VF550_08275, partial [Polyangia bacterium]
MASIILRNSSTCHSPTLGDSWRWSWDPLRTLSGWMEAESWPTSERAAANDVDFAPRFDVKESKG